LKTTDPRDVANARDEDERLAQNVGIPAERDRDRDEEKHEHRDDRRDGREEDHKTATAAHRAERARSRTSTTCKTGMSARLRDRKPAAS
jgi:hypothetical protein